MIYRFRTAPAPRTLSTRRALFQACLPTVLFLAAASFPIPCAAREELLTLGPGLLTYPEIAQALSRPESPITCSPRVRHRAALVYIKNRTREDILRLLSGALDIRFTPAAAESVAKPASSGLVLEADPAVVAREERWRRLLAARIRDHLARVEAHDQELLRRYEGWSQERLNAAYRSLDEQLNLLYKMTPDGEPYVEATDQPAFERLVQERSDIIRVRELLSPAPLNQLMREAYRQVFPRLSIERTIQTGLTRLVLPVSALSPSLVQGLLSEGVDATSLIASMWLSHDTYGIGFKFRACLLNAEGRELLRLPDSPGVISAASHPRRGGTLADEVFTGMRLNGEERDDLPPLSTDARNWLREQQDATQAFVATQAASVVLKDPTLAGGDALSRYVHGYCRERDTEVLMELWPGVEALEMRGRFKTLKAVQEIRTSWTFRETDGVLVVQNQLAFLDREPTRPVAPLVGFVRDMERRPAIRKKPNSESGRIPRPMTALAAYGAATGSLAYWTVPSSASLTFWGAWLGELDAVRAGLCIWETLTPEQKAELRAQGRLPLVNVDHKALRKAVDLLSADGMNYWLLAEKDPIRFLERGYLNDRLELEHLGRILLFPASVLIDWNETQ